MSIRHSDWDITCKVYIGGRGEDANRYDLEDAFKKFGPVKNVWVARRPPGFAFVEMEDPSRNPEPPKDKSSDDVKTLRPGYVVFPLKLDIFIKNSRI